MSIAKKLISTIRESVKTYSPKVSDSYLQLVQLFPLQPITSKNQHILALKVTEKIISYINEEKFKDEGAEIYLMTLIELIEDYERNQFKSNIISGIEMLKYLMELQGLNQSDLSKELGGQSVVSKILKGERELNLRQIKALAKRFKISPEVFI